MIRSPRRCTRRCCRRPDARSAHPTASRDAIARSGSGTSHEPQPGFHTPPPHTLRCSSPVSPSAPQPAHHQCAAPADSASRTSRASWLASCTPQQHTAPGPPTSQREATRPTCCHCARPKASGAVRAAGRLHRTVQTQQRHDLLQHHRVFHREREALRSRRSIHQAHHVAHILRCLARRPPRTVVTKHQRGPLHDPQPTHLAEQGAAAQRLRLPRPGSPPDTPRTLFFAGLRAFAIFEPDPRQRRAPSGTSCARIRPSAVTAKALKHTGHGADLGGGVTPQP